MAVLCSVRGGPEFDRTTWVGLGLQTSGRGGGSGERARAHGKAVDREDAAGNDLQTAIVDAARDGYGKSPAAPHRAAATIQELLFAQTCRLVADIGGILAHGSIVAREYGIPAVIGTGTATQRIATGQEGTVDGTAGTVTLIGRRSHP
jgi:phosphohistidine swiveling domain-containing protein